jgi:hypothetical protein
MPPLKYLLKALVIPSVISKTHSLASSRLFLTMNGKPIENVRVGFVDQ